MSNVWSLLGVLTVIILILVFAYYATRWIATHGVPGGAAPVRTDSAARFRLLAQIGVGRNERIVLVRLEQRCYLLGVTEHQITLLRELDGEEAAGWLRDSDSLPASPGFMEVLGEALRKKK
jgi:flagellar protein FliO/FliZ